MLSFSQLAKTEGHTFPKSYQLCDVLRDEDIDPVLEADRESRFQKNLERLSKLPDWKKKQLEKGGGI